MVNKYTGDVALRLDGWPAYTLRFDWEALAALQSQFGIDQAVKLITSRDANALLEITAIGLRCHHPEMTAATLRGDDHPAQMMPLMVKVGEALALAYNGPGGEAESGAANPPNRATRRAIARKTKKTPSGRR